MGIQRVILGIGVAVLTTALSQSTQLPRVDLILRGGLIIDPASATPPSRADIAIDAGRIVRIGPQLDQAYAAGRVLDVRFVMPGLADMHSHFGTGARPPGVDDTAVTLARFLYYGVTTTLNLGSFEAGPSKIDELREAMARGALMGPRLLAAGALITVPGSHPTTTIYSEDVREDIARRVARQPEGVIDLWPATRRATTLVRTAGQMRAEVRRLGEWGADAIKVIVESGPPEFGDDHPQMPPDLVAAAAEAAQPFGMPVLCHVSSADELEVCVEQGGAGAVHAVLDPAGLPRGLVRRMAEKGFTLIPTLTLYEGWARYPADPSLLDDPFLAPVLGAAERGVLAGDGIRSLFDVGVWRSRVPPIAAHVADAHRTGVSIVAGTDVGNPYRIAGHSLHEELASYVMAGLSPREALATATSAAARLAGGEDEWGAIREGLSADLLVLDANPLEDIRNTRAIAHVVRAGVVVDRQALPVR